jgi:hypothetical protein
MTAPREVQPLESYTRPAGGDHPLKPRPINDEDLRHGILTYELISAWSYWVKRRVETVELLSDTSARHRMSIDFRIRPWFPEASVKFGDKPYLYVPLMLLRKHPVSGLDVRDEHGGALPLLTRRKTAAIAAATLSVAAKKLLLADIDDRERRAPTYQRPLPDGIDTRAIVLPVCLEQYFYKIAYAEAEAEAPSTQELHATFLRTGQGSVSDETGPDWPWEPTLTRGGRVWQSATTSDADWRLYLAEKPSFLELLDDFNRLHLVMVPVRAERDARRIVKVSYLKHLRVPQLGMTARLRVFWGQSRIDDYAALKNHFEGILSRKGNSWSTNSQQSHPLTEKGSAGLSVLAWAGEAVGWRPKTMRLELPHVGHGGSYHMEFEAPPGLQIRQAILHTRPPGEEPQERTLMGAQTLRRAHLSVTNQVVNTSGAATIRLKVAPTTLVRGASLAALLSALLLFLGYWKLSVLTDKSQGNLGPTLALFLLLPGLFAGLLTRSDEHPLTTSMVFGLRCLCALVAALPTVGAFLILSARRWGPFQAAWQGLLGLSVFVLILLLTTWWLAARRRPDGSAP